MHVLLHQEAKGRRLRSRNCNTDGKHLYPSRTFRTDPRSDPSTTASCQFKDKTAGWLLGVRHIASSCKSSVGQIKASYELLKDSFALACFRFTPMEEIKIFCLWTSVRRSIIHKRRRFEVSFSSLYLNMKATKAARVSITVGSA